MEPLRRLDLRGMAEIVKGHERRAWNGARRRFAKRVIAPDQIGFCKSTKPERYQYSFQQLAQNTHALLEKLGVKKATLIGHSTGGMLAARYALMYPDETEQLVMINPIGLEDWKAKGVPFQQAQGRPGRKAAPRRKGVKTQAVLRNGFISTRF